MATARVNRKWQIPTSYRIETLESIAERFDKLDHVRETTSMQDLIANYPHINVLLK